ncbi:hypothetical protein GCM10027296_06280 [Chitinimonas naiadis]
MSLCGLVVGLSSGMGSTADTLPAMPRLLIVWQGFCLLLTVFCGGFIAASLAQLRRKQQGLIYGLLTWAVSLTLMACLTSTATSFLLGGIFNNVPLLATRGALVDTPIKGALLGNRLEALLRLSSEGAAISNLNTHKIHEWQILIEAGEREQAVAYMVRMIGFPEYRSASLVDQALILAGTPERASSQAREEAKHTSEVLNEISAAMLLSIAGSCVMAGVGGMLGTHAGRRYAYGLAKTLPRRHSGVS